MSQDSQSDSLRARKKKTQVSDHREGLPMTMKSCFYPLMGDKIFGWMGDLIDIVSIMTTMFGVCTSLGLGARQLISGFNLLNSDIDPNNISIQVIFYP